MKTPSEIKKALECCRGTYCPHDCPYYDECEIGRDTVINDFQGYVQQLESRVPKWIQVTARLPEYGTTCLISIKENWYGKIEHHVDIASFRDDGGGYIEGMWDTFNDWVEGQEIRVTHWMPLPDPCEEVSE